MAKKYIITAENAAEIKEFRKSVKDKYLDRRLYAVQLLGEGMKPKQIAEKLDADKRQIPSCNTECMNIFLEKLSKKFLENKIILALDVRPGIKLRN